VRRAHREAPGGKVITDIAADPLSRNMIQSPRLPGRCSDCSLCESALHGFSEPGHAASIEGMRRRSATFAARRILNYEGDAPKEVFQLFDGWAFRYKVTRDGRRQILSFILPGDLIDLPLLAIARINHAVKALTPISVCVFDRNQLADYVYADPLRARRVGALFAAHLGQADDRMLDLGQRSAFERIARLLGHLAAQLHRRGLSDETGGHFPLTQAHIADATGLTPVHVGRTLREMRKSNLLSLAQGRLTIHDPERLRAI
jgi:CRP-like cAMP-binding protein